jgi:hypothetical protein
LRKRDSSETLSLCNKLEFNMDFRILVELEILICFVGGTSQAELTLTLVEQCQQSQFKVQRIIEGGGDNDALLFEALNVNDELQQVLSKYEEMSKPSTESTHPEEPAFAHVQAEEDASNSGGIEESVLVRNRTPKGSTLSPISHDDAAITDLDAMIFGDNSKEETSKEARERNSDDLIKF